MTLDARARRAAAGFRRATDDLERWAPERAAYERFDRFRRRKERFVRARTVLVATALALAAIAFAFHALPRADRPARPAPQNGQIVFVRFDHHSGEPVTFTMRPDGSDMRQMFFSGFFSGHAEWPHWSPDGTVVSIFCCDDGKSPQLVDPATGSLREFPLVRAGVQRFCGAAWSPDGQRLACAGISHRHPRATGIWTIRAADGGDPRQLTSYPVGEDSPGDFSPDGTRLVFLRSDASDRPTGIFTVKIDGSDVQRLTPRGMIIDGFAGSWSPSGDKILFVAKTDRAHRWSIWSVDANGTGVQPIPIVGCGGAFADPGSAACTYPGWSPDGTKILFTLGIGKRSDIAIVNADGSGFVQITNSGDADEADWGTRATIP